LHLFFNMWVLLSVGGLMEQLTGKGGFLLLYLMSGVAGSIASLYWSPNLVSAGASGAIFGLFGGLLGFFLIQRLSVPLGVFRKVRTSGIAFFAFNLIFGLSIPGIDMAAHVGGALFGFVGGMILSRPVGLPARRTVRNVLLACGGGALLLGAALF